MSFQRVHQSRSQNLQTSLSTSQFAPRPFPVQEHKRPLTQEELENQAFQQNKFEATVLQLKQEYGTIAPVEQERLGMLQAKMDSFSVQRMERANTQPNLLATLISNAQSAQATEPAELVQPKLTIGQPNDRYEQEADRVASEVVQRINTPASTGESVQREAMPAVPSQEAIGGGDASTDLAAAINSARGRGQPLDAGLKQSIGQAMGADFSGVKVHTDAQADQLNRSIQARAFTTGQDVFFRQGEYNPANRGGQKLIAHDLTHVVQQNGHSGQLVLEKTDVSNTSDREGIIQRTGSTFTPFSGGTNQAVSLAGKTLDTLFEHGLQYPQGGTKGNAVNLEKMISDTGGGSAPGEPQDITDIKQYDAGLVRAYNQNNVATAMHAINHNFADPISTNLRPQNIFMGSARSNTQEHFYKVELPIRNSMKNLTAGNAKKYEANIQANPPTPLTLNPHILAWNNIGLDIPGVQQSLPLSPAQAAPLPNVTHVLNTNSLANVNAPWPKMIQYEVTPTYSYDAYPNFPQFLLDNINAAQALVDQANLQSTPRPNQTEIDNEVWAINRLKTVGNNLFPETFNCEAVYWFPSYNAAAPWKISTEKDDYDAEA